MGFWAISDDFLEDPAVIVPSNYGLCSEVELPDASRKAIIKAVKIAQKFSKAKIIFVSANYLWFGCRKQEEYLKLKLLKVSGIPEERIICAGGVGSTVKEAQAIHSKLKELSLNSGEIVVIADQMHARSSRLIFKKLIPGAKIKVCNINGVWDKTHPSKMFRSKGSFLLVNTLRHLAFCILGERIGWIRQP